MCYLKETTEYLRFLVGVFLQPGKGRAFHCIFPCKTALLITPDNIVEKSSCSLTV